MQIGDKGFIAADTGLIGASIVAIHDGGAIDAKIDEPNHPADGAVTHVAAGNFFSDKPAGEKTLPSVVLYQGAETHPQAKTEVLDKHTTVTRG